MTDYENTVYAVAVLLGDYPIYRKQAAIFLLKHYLGSVFLKFLLEDNALYPFKRNDYRVRDWATKITAVGECSICGSSENLEAHHVIRWADYPQGRTDKNNGQCLCLKCHTDEHRNDQSYHLMAGKKVNLCN